MLFAHNIENKWDQFATINNNTGDTLFSYQFNYSTIIEFTQDSINITYDNDRKSQSFKYRVIGQNIMKYDSSNQISYWATIIKLDSTSFDYIIPTDKDSTIVLHSKYVDIDFFAEE